MPSPKFPMSALMASMDELSACFQLEAIEPFGLAILSRTRERIDRIPGALLDQLVRVAKLVLLRDFAEITRDEFLRYCRACPGRQVLEWDFGPVMELREGPNPRNYLFSREGVPFHWDGAFHRVPTYLVFNCVEAPGAGAGGETLFTNTELIWAEASEADRSFWAGLELHYETARVAHYGGSITGRMVQSHPESGQPILRFAEPVKTDLNPVTLTILGIPDSKQAGFLEDMTRRIYSPRYCYQHTWHQPDILIADNHSLIHGRHPFTQHAQRHLRRIQLI